MIMRYSAVFPLQNTVTRLIMTCCVEVKTTLITSNNHLPVALNFLHQIGVMILCRKLNVAQYFFLESFAELSGCMMYFTLGQEKNTKRSGYPYL